MRAVFYLKSEDYNIFLYSILRQAECTFIADDEMTLTIEKNVIAEERLEELLQILEKIFCERCGMHFKVADCFQRAGGEQVA